MNEIIFRAKDANTWACLFLAFFFAGMGWWSGLNVIPTVVSMLRGIGRK